MIRAYSSILTLRFREVAQYRAAAWAGVFTQVVFGFIIFMSLDAFFRADPDRAPMNRQQLLSYVWLAQAFLGLLPWNIDTHIAAMVRSGAVAYELARPIDTYALWYSRTLGWRVSATVLRSVPLIVIVALVFPLVGLREYAMPAPPTLACAGAFGIALFIAVLLGAALTMLMHVTILWTLSIDGVQRIMPAFIMLLSGMLIPLPVFPDWMQPILYALPFRCVVDLPYRAYSGDIAPVQALRDTALALAWTVAIVWFGRALMRRGFRRVVVHGG